jgi:hypothetical protein
LGKYDIVECLLDVKTVSKYIKDNSTCWQSIVYSRSWIVIIEK